MAQKAVRLQASVDHLDTLAEAYFQSGQPIEAIQTIRRAILITPLIQIVIHTSLSNLIDSAKETLIQLHPV